MPLDQIKIGLPNGAYFEARGNNAKIMTAAIAICIVIAVAYIVSKIK